MTPPPGPDALCIGQARLTAGLDRIQRIDLTTHYSVFGSLPRLTANQLVDATERVNLYGRGGAAFPFSRKLQSVMQSARQRKKRVVVLVNATEGEPGSAKDRMLLLRSPYLVLGGALIAARALQAREIVIGVRPGVRRAHQPGRADRCRRHARRRHCAAARRGDLPARRGSAGGQLPR